MSILPPSGTILVNQVNGTGDLIQIALNANSSPGIVFTSGTQTISGVKVFSNHVTFSGLNTGNRTFDIYQNPAETYTTFSGNVPIRTIVPGTHLFNSNNTTGYSGSDVNRLTNPYQTNHNIYTQMANIICPNFSTTNVEIKLQGRALASGSHEGAYFNLRFGIATTISGVSSLMGEVIKESYFYGISGMNYNAKITTSNNQFNLEVKGNNSQFVSWTSEMTFQSVVTDA